jgi:hypothetical protein
LVFNVLVDDGSGCYPVWVGFGRNFLDLAVLGAVEDVLMVKYGKLNRKEVEQAEEERTFWQAMVAPMPEWKLFGWTFKNSALFYNERGHTVELTDQHVRLIEAHRKERELSERERKTDGDHCNCRS